MTLKPLASAPTTARGWLTAGVLAICASTCQSTGPSSVASTPAEDDDDHASNSSTGDATSVTTGDDTHDGGLVPQAKKALLITTGATWCGPCGFYHHVTTEVYEQRHEDIVVINAHVSTSELGDAVAGDFHNELNGGGGIPSFNVSGTLVDDWPPHTSGIIATADAFLDTPVVANVAFDYAIDGDELRVTASAEFFEDTSGEFFITVFVLENAVESVQNMGESYEPLVQDRLSRGPMQPTVDAMWGEQIAAGNVAAGSRFEAEFARDLPTAWVRENLEFVAVLWNRDGHPQALSAQDQPR